MFSQGLLERPTGFYFQARISKKYQSCYPEAVLREKLLTNVNKQQKKVIILGLPKVHLFFYHVRRQR